MVNHIHLDLVGGLYGDMFISGMLDAFPQFRKGLAQVIVDAAIRDNALEIFRLIAEVEAAIHSRKVFPGIYNPVRVSSFAFAKADLPRKEVVVQLEEKLYRVKASRRPEGYTAKVEMGDLLAAGLYRQEQESVRVQAQRLVIEQVENH